jgi:hypothetical protein
MVGCASRMVRWSSRMRWKSASDSIKNRRHRGSLEV